MTLSTTFTRHALASMHRQVRELCPHIKTPMKAMSCYQHSTGSYFTCQLRENVNEGFFWEGRASDAYDARYKAWDVFLTDKYGSDDDDFDPMQIAWERAMGMRGYAGSPAQAEAFRHSKA